MQAPEVKIANSSDRDAVLRTITLGFAADPIARWLWPDPATYLETMPRFAAAFGGKGFDHETVYATGAAGKGATSASGVDAAAMWLPPDVNPDEEELMGVLGASIAESRMGEIGSLFEQMDSFHPETACWYLPLIAADPISIGQGLGGTLMKHALQRCDEDGLIAYLESSNLRNISLYERHGFQTIGEIQAGDSPVMTPMVREPRR
ncbi:MAG: GNAT family N-acetyltransferase [Pseudomonadota bacterium]